ncbi:MAG: hypothetical protein K6E22_01155 [Treponema sp.]|nr:hypothetical protein [Treponema sp.]
MYIQSKFSQNTIERIFADFQINSGEEVLYAIWLSGGRKGFVFTDRRFYWNIKTSIVRNSEVTDVKLPSNIMEKNVNGLSVKIISKEKEKTSPASKYLYFALISHIGLIRYDAASLSYDEALKLKKIFTQYINESTLPEPRHKSFMDKVWANKEDAVDFLWCLKNGSLFKRQHKYIATRQDIEARNEKITSYEEEENPSQVYEDGEELEYEDRAGSPQVQDSRYEAEDGGADEDRSSRGEIADDAGASDEDLAGDSGSESSEVSGDGGTVDKREEASAYGYDDQEEVPPGPGREYLRESAYQRSYDEDEEDDSDESDEEENEGEEASDARKKHFVQRRLRALLIRQKRAKARREAERYAASRKSEDESYEDEDAPRQNADSQDTYSPDANASGQNDSRPLPLQNIHYHILDVFVTLVYATASLFAVKPILFAKSIAKPLNGIGRFFAEFGKLFFFGDKATAARLSEIEIRSDYVTVLIDKRNCVFAVLLIFYLIGRSLLILRNKEANKKLCFILMLGFVLISFLMPVKFFIFLLLAFAIYGAMQFAEGASKMTLLCKLFAFLLLFGMEYYLVHLLLYPGFPDVMANVVQILGLHANW